MSWAGSYSHFKIRILKVNRTVWLIVTQLMNGIQDHLTPNLVFFYPERKTGLFVLGVTLLPVSSHLVERGVSPLNPVSSLSPSPSSLLPTLLPLLPASCENRADVGASPVLGMPFDILMLVSSVSRTPETAWGGK